MSRGKRAYLRPDLRLEAGLSQKFELPPPGIQVTPRRDERISEKCDELFGSRRGRVEVPRPEIGVFEDHPTAWSDEAEIARELVRGTPQRPDLEPAMHEIERVRVKLAVEQIVMRDLHVGEMVLLDERVSRIQTPEAQAPVYGNRRRVRGARGRRLLRQRGESVERSFAHLYDTGGLRRTHLRGHSNILKRLLIHAGAFNLGLLMRQVFGRGTPRGLQGRRIAPGAPDITLGTLLDRVWTAAMRLWYRPRPRPTIRPTAWTVVLAG